MQELFVNGTWQGEGRWVDQKAEGRYAARYTITDGPEGAKVHRTERDFLKDDGSVAYEERSTLTFTSGPRNSLRVEISGDAGSVSGTGYAFDHECHYEADIAGDNRLEFSFRRNDERLHGVGSATNKGNFCSWSETVTRK